MALYHVGGLGGETGDRRRWGVPRTQRSLSPLRPALGRAKALLDAFPMGAIDNPRFRLGNSMSKTRLVRAFRAPGESAVIGLLVYQLLKAP